MRFYFIVLLFLSSNYYRQYVVLNIYCDNKYNMDSKNFFFLNL